jgi:hypothetical protein
MYAAAANGWPARSSRNTPNWVPFGRPVAVMENMSKPRVPLVRLSETVAFAFGRQRASCGVDGVSCRVIGAGTPPAVEAVATARVAISAAPTAPATTRA